MKKKVATKPDNWLSLAAWLGSIPLNSGWKHRKGFHDVAETNKRGWPKVCTPCCNPSICKNFNHLWAEKRYSSQFVPVILARGLGLLLWKQRNIRNVSKDGVVARIRNKQVHRYIFCLHFSQALPCWEFFCVHLSRNTFWHTLCVFFKLTFLRSSKKGDVPVSWFFGLPQHCSILQMQPLGDGWHSRGNCAQESHTKQGFYRRKVRPAIECRDWHEILERIGALLGGLRYLVFPWGLQMSYGKNLTLLCFGLSGMVGICLLQLRLPKKAFPLPSTGYVHRAPEEQPTWQEVYQKMAQLVLLQCVKAALQMNKKLHFELDNSPSATGPTTEALSHAAIRKKNVVGRPDPGRKDSLSGNATQAAFKARHLSGMRQKKNVQVQMSITLLLSCHSCCSGKMLCITKQLASCSPFSFLIQHQWDHDPELRNG